MKRSSIQLSIPTPCHESWQSMTPDNKGRFCQNCQKTVIDFSVMSDQEIVRVMNNEKGDMCGYFRPDQLNREISDNSAYRPWASVAAMITALTFTAPTVNAKSPSAQVQMITDVKTADRSRDKLPIINGTVTDSTNKPIPGVFIQISDYNIYAVTDEKGNFSFRLPSGFHKKKATLHVQSQGYITRDITVSAKKASNIGNITMLSDGTPPPAAVLTGVLGGMAPGVRIKLPSFWQRMKRKVTGTLHSILFM